MSFTYDAANQMTTMLQGSLLTTYTFDANGNQQLEHTPTANTQYHYDDENRLTLMTAPAVRNTYTCNGDSLRTTHIEISTTLTTEIWDGTDYPGEY
jgi:YD repeat-containing protein